MQMLIFLAELYAAEIALGADPLALSKFCSGQAVMAE